MEITKSGYQNTLSVQLINVSVSNVKVLAGINANYGDSSTFTNIVYSGGHVCQRFEGNNSGAKPSKIDNQCNGKTPSCVCIWIKLSYILA